jgi:hypothetical protein
VVRNHESDPCVWGQGIANGAVDLMLNNSIACVIHRQHANVGHTFHQRRIMLKAQAESTP